MEFSQLRTLIHVAELGSLSKAADQLNIAQPALSRQVKMLEEELGTRLFDRHGRGMVATEAGQDILVRARRVLAEIEEMRVVSSDPDAPLRGHVSIGMPPTISDILAAPIVSAFNDRHPDATLRVVSAYSGFLLDWVHRGHVDVAVLYDPKSAQSLRSQPLLEEILYLIGSASQKLPKRAPVAFSKLDKHNLLLPSRGHGLRDLLESCASRNGSHLNVKVEADSYSTLKNLVLAGHGTTILPLAPIHSEIVTGELTAAPISNPTPSRKLILSYPSDRPTSRLALFAAETIEATVSDLVNSGVWVGHVLGDAK